MRLARRIDDEHDSQRLIRSPSPSSFAATLPALCNLREAPPYLGGASYLHVPSKVKVEADAVEIDRTRTSGITWSQETPQVRIRTFIYHLALNAAVYRNAAMRPASAEV